MKELIALLREEASKAANGYLDFCLEAADALERLTAENAALREGLDGWHARYLDMEVEFARLVDVCHAAKLRLATERDELFNRATTAEFERDALSADADRYRWLRSTTNSFTNSDGRRINVKQSPDQWDSAIDAAIAGEKT